MNLDMDMDMEFRMDTDIATGNRHGHGYGHVYGHDGHGQKHGHEHGHRHRRRFGHGCGQGHGSGYGPGYAAVMGMRTDRFMDLDIGMARFIRSKFVSKFNLIGPKTMTNLVQKLPKIDSTMVQHEAKMTPKWSPGYPNSASF